MRTSTLLSIAAGAAALPSHPLNHRDTAAPGIRAASITELGPRSQLEARQYASNTYNQLTDGTPCRPVTVLYARGTFEAGNIGDATTIGAAAYNASVGQATFNALAALIGESNIALQGIDYPADIFGYLLGGDANGSKLMASLVSTAATKCPSTKIVMAGYSQGGQLVHNAAANLTADLTRKVNAVLIYGDPFSASPVGNIPAAKVNVFCHTGDMICNDTIIITPAHLNYQENAGAGASWIAKMVS